MAGQPAHPQNGVVRGVPGAQSQSRSRVAALRSISVYRLGKCAIPLFACAYLFMIWVRPVAGVTADEIFPFFAWTLFSHTPDWHSEERGVIAHAINDRPVRGVRYLTPSREVGRSQKILFKTVRICQEQPQSCDAAVERLLYPVVKELARSDNLEFSIVLLRTSLHEVRAAIDDLAARKVRRRHFYRQTGSLGRWHTQQGRLPDAAHLPVGNALPVATALPAAVAQNSRQAQPHLVCAAIDDQAAGKLHRRHFHRQTGSIGCWHTQRVRLPTAAHSPVVTALSAAVAQNSRQAQSHLLAGLG